MDELRKEFATDIEFEIALYILDILKEQPQIFLIEDVLNRLHKVYGADRAKCLLYDYTFFKMQRIGYTALVNGAVRLDHKGVSYIANRNLTENQKGYNKILQLFKTLMKRRW